MVRWLSCPAATATTATRHTTTPVNTTRNTARILTGLPVGCHYLKRCTRTRLRPLPAIPEQLVIQRPGMRHRQVRRRGLHRGRREHRRVRDEHAAWPEHRGDVRNGQRLFEHGVVQENV